MSKELTLESEILTAWDLAALAFKVRGMQSGYFKMPKGDAKNEALRKCRLWEKHLDNILHECLRKSGEINKLANMISLVRQAQSDYFENRTQSNLSESIQLEKSLDARLLEYLKGVGEAAEKLKAWNETGQNAD